MPLILVPLRKPLFLYEHYILLDRLTLDMQLVSRKIWIWIANRYAAQNRQLLGDCQLRAKDLWIPSDRDLETTT